jgi:hypothetical protein
MFKITLYDETCSPFCDDVASFFTEDIEEFERNWRPYVSKEKLSKFLRSKAGEIEYYIMAGKSYLLKAEEEWITISQKDYPLEDY